MAIQKVPRNPEHLEILRVYSAVEPEEAIGSALGDGERIDEFLRRARESLECSVKSEGRMHGLRAQALFRATLVALGGFQLLTDEDAGNPYYDDADGRLSPPDFRVVDRSGDPVLIEVKSVKLNDPLKPFALRSQDVEAWRRWGELSGAPVSLALWWTVPGQWTLIKLDHLRKNGSKLEVDLPTAIGANEMSRFGDRMIGTRPPLTFRLAVDQLGPALDAERVRVKIKDAELWAGGQRIKDSLERRIAWWLLRFGTWEIDQELRYDSDGNAASIDLIASPPQYDEEQGFAFIGWLSSLYAALFNEKTLSAEGQVRELEHQPRPEELAELIPDDYWEQPDRVLKLWRANIYPREPATSCE
jgi:hypothetical protein